MRDNKVLECFIKHTRKEFKRDEYYLSFLRKEVNHGANGTTRLCD